MEDNGPAAFNNTSYPWPMNSKADVIDAVLEYIDELDYIEQEEAIKRVRVWLAHHDQDIEETITALQAEVNTPPFTPIIMDNKDYCSQSLRFDN